ncbi:MAG: hypothetical protein FJ387_06025 [Verrucomicrobia bacterium]|nr:hypothetical protein [Verrucomicrobiota bacterium]
MTTATANLKLSRRECATAGLGALGVAALGLWAGAATRGVAAERRFLERCVRCGQCGGACPEQELDGERRKAIRCYGVSAGAQAGTPFITPRWAPCLMCVELPCVRACPSGALDPRLLDIDDARMGTASIVDREGCLALQGLRCEVCFNRCPRRGVALTLQHTLNRRTERHAVLEPVVHKDACTGCGLCERVCVREEPVNPINALLRSLQHVTAGGLGLVAGVLALEALTERRLFCRPLCPVGGFYGTINRWGAVGVAIDPATCTGCRQCATFCLAAPELEAAIGQARRAKVRAPVESAHCTLCWACARGCARGGIRVHHRWRRLAPPRAATVLQP